MKVKCPLFLSDFNQTGIFYAHFIKKKLSNIAYHENPSSDSGVASTGKDG
jgi:hypothetical protein